MSNPLSIRLPLYNPDRLLSYLAPLFAWVFSGFGLFLWLTICGLALLMGITGGAEIAAAIGAKQLGGREVLMFWLLYPVVKALHELAHGLALKVWGGEVHETGINLLIFVPVPYVDASAAWRLGDKRRRALVGAAGILVELLLAAIGILVFFAVEPGIVRDIALNVALIGGISTLFFNGNPLLRFDGYYVLEDLVEIPNLASRSSRYHLYLIQRYLLGIADSRTPVTTQGERQWFFVYGLASPVYRLVVLVAIALYLADEFFVVGVALASWAVGMQVLRPVVRAIHFLATSERLAAQRIRGFVVFGLVMVACLGLLSIRAPLLSHVEGVVWADENSRVVSGVDGTVAEVFVSAGQPVVAGQPLYRLENRQLLTQARVLEARLKELKVQHSAEQQQSRVRGAMVKDDITALQKEQAMIQELVASLTVRAQSSGRFEAVSGHSLQDRFIQQGDLLAYVMTGEAPVVRAVIDQHRIGLLRSEPEAIEVLLAERVHKKIPARLLREVPGGNKALPSRALGVSGGGSVAVDRSDDSGLTAAQRVFQFDLELPHGTPVAGIGERVYVRLDHGHEAIWRQWARSLRQLLLSRLSV